MNRRAGQPCIRCGEYKVIGYLNFYSRCDGCGFIWIFRKYKTLYWTNLLKCGSVPDGVLFTMSETEL